MRRCHAGSDSASCSHLRRALVEYEHRHRERRAAGARPERDHLRSEHAGQRDPGNGRRDPRPAGRRRDGHEPSAAPVQAGCLRQCERTAADEGGLLHRGRRPGCLAGRRDDQRQDRGVQPLPGRWGHEQLCRAGQLLAHAVQPVAQHQRPRAGRLSRVCELLGSLAGRLHAPSPRRRRQPLAHGLLHGGSAVRQRRLHRRFEAAVRGQRLATAVADPKQRDRRLVERRLEPGLRGCRGGAGRGWFPGPALHHPRYHARQPREAVPVRRWEGRLQRPRAFSADRLEWRLMGRRHDGGTDAPTPRLLHREAVGLSGGDQQGTGPRHESAADPRHLRRRDAASP